MCRLNFFSNLHIYIEISRMGDQTFDFDVVKKPESLLYTRKYI